jgi:hypothetical protein
MTKSHFEIVFFHVFVLSCEQEPVTFVKDFSDFLKDESIEPVALWLH